MSSVVTNLLFVGFFSAERDIRREMAGEAGGSLNIPDLKPFDPNIITPVSWCDKIVVLLIHMVRNDQWHRYITVKPHLYALKGLQRQGINTQAT